MAFFLHSKINRVCRSTYSPISALAIASALGLSGPPAFAGGPGDLSDSGAQIQAGAEELQPRLFVKFFQDDSILGTGTAKDQRSQEINSFLQSGPSQPGGLNFDELELEVVAAIGSNSGIFTLSSSNEQMGVQQFESMQEIADRISQLPEVEYAEVEPIATIQNSLPRDPRLSDMWHLTDDKVGVGASDAWPNATGKGAVVAIIDTGYLPHGDLEANRLPGYDFISVAQTANDGDGRDADASDPGDWCRGRPSSWHGTHVAGTVSAVANNIGIAGVAYESNYVPVRVLGKCGGYGGDIAAGIRWAAGLPVPGVPSNPNPADVINLSLGGRGDCSPIYQDAIDEAVAAGTTVVVAAGNSNLDASNFAPANCDGVITVASTNRKGGKSFYSNFGATVEVSAPGGETWNVQGDGVLSTLNSGTTSPGSDTFEFYQGTSMAAPHVAGIAALVYQVDPAATPTSVLSAIQSSSKPFATGTGSDCTNSSCGTGIADATAASQYSFVASTNVNEVREFGADGETNQRLIVPAQAVDGWVGVDSEGFQYPLGTLNDVPDMSPSAPQGGEFNALDDWLDTEENYQKLLSLPVLSLHEGTIGPELIIGSDDRSKVANTTRFPQSAQVLVVLPNGRCSGAMIGPDLVLTAGHCVHRNGAWQANARVYPGRDGRQAPFGSCNATRFYSVLGWTRDANPAYDFGAIKLNCDIGQRTGWMGFFWQTASLVGIPAQISSYPGDKPLEQWVHGDHVHSNSALQTRYQTDTVGGNSGSGVFAATGVPAGCGQCIHTVHAYGGTTFNSGTRITKPLFENLINWRNAPKGNVLGGVVKADLN